MQPNRKQDESVYKNKNVIRFIVISTHAQKDAIKIQIMDGLMKSCIHRWRRQAKLCDQAGRRVARSNSTKLRWDAIMVNRIPGWLNGMEMEWSYIGQTNNPEIKNTFAVWIPLPSIRGICGF